MPIPNVESAPRTAPSDAGGPGAGPRSRTSSRRRHRHARVRRIRLWRVTLVLLTAAMSAVALVAAYRLEGGRPDAAASKLSAAKPTHGQDTAFAQNAWPILPPYSPPAVHHAPRATPRAKPSHRPAVSYPSGLMPAGNIPGWHLTYSQDFNGDYLPSGWGAYSGQPGGDPNGNWDPANVDVSNGELHLTANSGSTGGVGFSGNPQTYGMYLVRMKGDYEPGAEISNIALLWPADGSSWPPEIDFYEDGGGNRDGYTASMHPGPNGDDCCVIRHSTSNTGAQWHTYGVIWTSSSITYTIDGKPWAKVQQSEVSSPGSWPDMPMNLDLQSQNLGGDQPGGGVDTMTVAWVAEYAPGS
jgi:Glycosyl hydrolases family 16